MITHLEGGAHLDDRVRWELSYIGKDYMSLGDIFN